MKMLGYLCLAALAAPADLYNPVADGQLPQYIFFHTRTPGHTRPERDTPELLGAILREAGRGHARLRTGVAFTFNILQQPPANLVGPLERLLRATEAADLPVFLCLDGQNWWEKRPDLWNWWDPKLPGYNPANRANVEWIGWGPEHAVKIGWRNWGRQLRVAPAPNIASPAFLAEHDKAFRVLIPVILEWYRALPSNRKYLFGGLKVGWEASINVNAYYYPGGNAIFERQPKDASGDPNHRDRDKGWSFGSPALGYNAVFTSGIRKSGDLAKEDIEAVVHNYLKRLSKAAFELGVPKHLIFTHQGGTYAPWEKHLSFKPAINEYAVPGWSFYSHDPQECGSLSADLEEAGRRQWAAVEWLRKSQNTEEWKERLRRTLGFKQCRLLNIYNWELLRDFPGAVDAVRSFLQETR